MEDLNSMLHATHFHLSKTTSDRGLNNYTVLKKETYENIPI